MAYKQFWTKERLKENFVVGISTKPLQDNKKKGNNHIIILENVPFENKENNNSPDLNYFIEEHGDVSDVQKIISKLKDDKFSNEDKRKEFAQMIVSLVHSKDKDARKVIKELGNFMSSYGDNDIETIENDPFKTETKTFGNTESIPDEVVTLENLDYMHLDQGAYYNEGKL